MFIMIQMFLMVTFLQFPLSVIQDTEVSVKMPDNETVVLMKIDVHNDETMHSNHGVIILL